MNRRELIGLVALAPAVYIASKVKTKPKKVHVTEADLSEITHVTYDANGSVVFWKDEMHL